VRDLTKLHLEQGSFLWNTIKQRLHTSKWLLPILGRLYIDVEHIRDKLFQLYNNAIYWMEKLIMIGLKVFAHGSYANLTHEILWNITRGLEDFNNILNGLPKAARMFMTLTNGIAFTLIPACRERFDKAALGARIFSNL
jgi:hypothetical protein